MIELIYGTKDFARIAWQEIEAGRPVALRVTGWKRRLIHQTLSLYAENDRLWRSGKAKRTLALRLAWRTMLTPPLIGLCHYAQSSGMAVTVLDKGTTLEVRFEKPTLG